MVVVVLVAIKLVVFSNVSFMLFFLQKLISDYDSFESKIGVLACVFYFSVC